MAQLGVGDAVVVPGEREQPRRLLLGAARVVMLLGAAAAISTVGSSPGPGPANVALAFIGFFVWLLGVCFLFLVPAAERFPRGALVGATAMANAVLKHCFALWKWNWSIV